MISLIEKILQGDKRATVAFYQQYSPNIFDYLKKRLPREEDAQEVLHDVFLEALDALPLLRKKESISSWLYTIARNEVVDFYRKQKIKSILLSQIPFLQLVANEVNQPEFEYEKERVRERIEKSFSLLSPHHQKILRLHYEDGIAVKQLAIFFNLSFKATESLLFRARQSFIRAYERTAVSFGT
ncbi:RNA polymerase sigma factor [Candidatus Shapirobacteria bacterium]|nr:RNA polymerase sigma factor [Candidatus Shapirobacteria bacterium]